MDTQYTEYFSQMMYLAGRIALLDDQTSEHWAKLEPVNAQAEPAAMLALDEIRAKRKMLTGYHLKQLRTASGLSFVELASLVSVEPSAIQRWEQQGHYVNVPKHPAEAIRRWLAEKAARREGRN